MKAKRVTISITLPENLAKQLDEYAAKMKMDKSHFVEWLLENAMPVVPAVSELLKDMFKKSKEK